MRTVIIQCAEGEITLKGVSSELWREFQERTQGLPTPGDYQWLIDRYEETR